MTEDTGAGAGTHAPTAPDDRAPDQPDQAPVTSPDPASAHASAPVSDPAPDPAPDRSRPDRRAARRSRKDLASALRAERRRVSVEDQRRARVAALGHRPGVLGGSAGRALDPSLEVGVVRELWEQSVGLLRAMHPRTALLGGLAVGGLALASGRPPREAVVAGAGILVTLAVLGLFNDVRDQERDRASAIPRKPIAEGRLPAGNASFVAVCLAVVLVPLSLQNGVLAAGALLGVLLLGLLSNLWLRRTWLSWLPWAGSFALVPAYLSYGGWGLGVQGRPPTVSVTVLAALLGVAVHFLLALPDLVADRKSGFRHLPLRIALRTGATSLLVVSVVFTGAVALGLVASGVASGLSQ